MRTYIACRRDKNIFIDIIIKLYILIFLNVFKIYNLIWANIKLVDRIFS